ARMTSYFARSASFQGIANLPKLLQTKGINGREAGQPISGQVLRNQRLSLRFTAASPEDLTFSMSGVGETKTPFGSLAEPLSRRSAIFLLLIVTPSLSADILKLQLS
ncbi:hypothetical protein, partial [Rhodoblastus sp.]|uniref:hypothetical protein n=1 Tax=Rhodoblastus sp. TaxID=1962975 RepID=UPI003FD7F7EA